jgi:chaperone modulatory protein CbpM
MIIENLIPIDTLCIHYQVTDHFFYSLATIGLIEIQEVKKVAYIKEDAIHQIEKILRLQVELELNLEGIVVVFNLLHKIDSLQNELTVVKNRLLLYES